MEQIKFSYNTERMEKKNYHSFTDEGTDQGAEA